MEKNEIKKVLENQQLFLQKMENLEDRIKNLEQGTLSRSDSEKQFDVTDLISLPDHLRSTMVAVVHVGDGTAEQIAEKTGRVRNLESSYLNQLVRIGHVQKFRKGRKVYFKPTYIKTGLVSIIKSLNL